MARRNLHWLEAEDGATLILVALSLSLLLGASALALDLASLRLDMRTGQLAADNAVTAGVAELDPFSGTDAQDACNTAWDYFLINIEDEGASVVDPICSLLSGSCDPAVAREASGSAGPYLITITHPVPDGHALMGTQAINVQHDGVPCQRLAVRVRRTRQFMFANVIGFESGNTDVSAVARNSTGAGAGEIVPLLVLEPISCDALYTSGQGRVTIDWFEETPGFIVVDSDGSKSGNPNKCGSSSWAIDSKGTQNGWIRAIPTPTGVPSSILSYALSQVPPADQTRSYDPDDLTYPISTVDENPPSTWWRLYPKPSFISRRITRAAIDHRYNCKGAYPDYPLDLNDASLGGIPIAPCLEPADPLIDELIGAYGGPVGNPPVGNFQRWSTANYPCTIDAGFAGSNPLIVSGNWYVDCPGGFIVGSENVVEFSGGDLVFDGNVQLKTKGSLIINPSGSSDRIVFVRDGDLLKGAQSSITLRQTFVLLQKGFMDLGGGPGGLVWTAPLLGPFEDLALWAEAEAQFQIGGQAGNELVGTFFTPFASPFSLTGQGTQSFPTDAQFIVRRLEVKGTAVVKMRPNAERSTKVDIREIRLIR